MHDSKAVQAVIETVRKHAGGKPVRAVELEVGELSEFEADHLVEHLREVTDWEITAVTTQSRVQCACGFFGRARILERDHDFVFYTCPNCQNKPQILEGDAIRVKKIGTIEN